MKVVVAIDSFKGSLSSREAGEAAKRGILSADKTAVVSVSAVADGGEGTFEALFSELCDERVDIEVTGPVYERVTASYGINRKTLTSLIEMSSAAGLPLVPSEKRDPRYTTTLGVGEMIRDALEKGARKFIIGLGGSATNDCGIGMLTALGFEFLDSCGRAVSPSAAGLGEVCEIRTEKVHPALEDASFTVLCDVENPLCGEKGCSFVYAPQKGASAECVREMDGWIYAFSETVKEYFPSADRDARGCGAAGGMGYALTTFLNARLERGIDVVIRETALEEKIKNADIVITGEGRLDSQSVMGKTPIGIARLAKKHGKRVIALAGCIGSGAEACNENGIDAFFSIQTGAISLEDAMRKEIAKENTKRCTEQIMRLILSFVQEE